MTAETIDWQDLRRSWRLHMRARNLSDKTVTGYLYALDRYLASDPQPPYRRHLEWFLANELTRYKATSVSVWYRALQQFFRWATAESELLENPMLGLRPPTVVEQPPPVLTPEEIQRLFLTTNGTNFIERRDHAILRFMLDTGCRRGELATLVMPAINLDTKTALVRGKGRRERVVPFGDNTAAALDRYLRVRRRHHHRDLELLWLSHMGAFTSEGIFQMVARRGTAAGIPRLHPHTLRHTFAHRWLAADGSETNLQTLAGWKSAQMLRRYGASAATARAIDAHRRLALGDEV